MAARAASAPRELVIETKKTIQAMGRIGRTHIQQTYTIRFRDDAMVTQLFLPPSTPNMEAEQMNRLFSM
jgi:hypothetical protein